MLFDRIYRRFLRRIDPPRYNDIILRPKNMVHDGALPLGSKAAIYLIFPKSGLLKSHVVALQYMIENGYSPIVVSNLPLSPSDLDQLRPVTYRTLQRENFGYDFGGYREAILVFQDQIKTLDHLALFNDSVWFPVQNTRNWLRDAEAANKDLMGAISHVDVGSNELRQDLALLSNQSRGSSVAQQKIVNPQSWMDEFSNLLIDYKAPPKLVLGLRNFLRTRRIGNGGNFFHYCSFALLLKRTMLRDPQFYKFWQELQISDKWVQTIIRGEIGFTQWAIKRQFSHGCTIDAATISQTISKIDTAKLEYYLSKIVPLRRHRALFEVYVEDQGVKRRPESFSVVDKQNFLRALLRLDNKAYTAPSYLHHEHGFQFFKKKNFSVTRYGRNVAIDMIADMPEPIKSEMWDMVAKTEPTQAQTSTRISGKRKIFGVWVGLPSLWD